MTLVPGARRVSALTRIPCLISACAVTLLSISLCVAGACTARRALVPIDESGPPVRGGTLEVVGSSDPEHLATTSGYTFKSMWLARAYARQLVSYPRASDFATKTTPAADLATEVPTQANGGVSADGLTYTSHLRRGVRWNSTLPRDVTAHDVVRAFRLFCNPVSPVAAPAYYTSTIAGMTRYCDQFAQVPRTVSAIREFVTTRGLEGVVAADQFTVVFRLQAPAPDFLNLLAMTFASPVPVEYLDHLPGSPEFQQHTISCGPYRIARYLPNRELVLDRNPVWEPATDPVRPAYVDRIRLRLGADAQLQQLQIEAGTADLSYDEGVPVAEVGSLLALGDPTMWLCPPGDQLAHFVFLAVNHVGPNHRRALTFPRVRRAIALAVDKAALVQLAGGPALARPLRQAVFSSAAGFRKGGDLFLTAGDRGDPSAARALLAEAGYPQVFWLRLAYPTGGFMSLAAQALQASLRRAGVDLRLVPTPSGDYFSRFLPNSENALRGDWDLALTGWIPDWFGDGNGRSVIAPLFDGRQFGGSQNYGGYANREVDTLIDRATTADTPEHAEQAWQEAARLAMEDVAIVPLIEEKYANARSRRVRGCTWAVFGLNCDLTALWLDRR